MRERRIVTLAVCVSQKRRTITNILGIEIQPRHKQVTACPFHNTPILPLGQAILFTFNSIMCIIAYNLVAPCIRDISHNVRRMLMDRSDLDAPERREAIAIRSPSQPTFRNPRNMRMARTRSIRSQRPSNVRSPHERAGSEIYPHDTLELLER